MNGNAVGERTLEYLRGERDLFEERKRLEEIRKQVEDLNLSYWLTGEKKRRVERFWKVVSLLQKNSRMTLVDMSKKLKVPVSTLFDTLKKVEKVFHFTIVLKDSESNALSKSPPSIEFAQEFLIEVNEEETTSNVLIDQFST